MELRKKKLIEDGGKRADRITGNTAHVWRVKPPIELSAALEKKEEKQESAKVEANTSLLL